MKPKTAILLLVVLLVLIGVIVTRQLKLRQAGEPTVTMADVWEAKIGEVQAVTIEAADGPPLRLQRSDGKWLITEPISTEADEGQVNRAIDPIKTLTFKRSIKPGQADAPTDKLTGLDKPLWKVTLTDSDGKDHILLVGKPIPLSAAKETYVRRADSDTIYVVAVGLAGRLDKPVSDLRSKNVLGLDKAKIDKLSILGPEKLRLARTDGLWGLSEPISAAADDDKVGSFLDKFINLTASEFIEDDPESLRPYGLEPGRERLVVRVWTEAEPATTQPETRPAVPAKSYALALGSKTEDKRYAKLVDSPAVFLVREGLLEELTITLADLRDMQVMAVAGDQVVRVELDLPKGKAELVKKDDVWHMVSPFEGKANGDAVDNLLSDLNSLKAESIRDDVQVLARFGLEPPVGTMTIHQAGKSEKQILLVGSASPSGEMTFLKLAASDTVAVVKTAVLQPLLADPAAYWATRLLKVPEDAEVDSLTIARPDGRFELVKAEDSWKMTAPLPSKVDPINVQKVLSKLRDLKAQRIVWLGDQVPKKYTDAKERMAITFSAVEQAEAPTKAESQPTTKPAPVTHTYRLQLVDIPGETCAWVPGSDPISVGQCYGGLWKTLTSELRDRSVWQLDKEKIATIKLKAGPTALELARQEDTWKYIPDPYVDIDSSKVARFLDDIRQVKAERFASHDAANADDVKKFGLDNPWFILSLVDESGKMRTLTVSNEGTDDTANRYATESDIQGVLVISSDIAGRMAVRLENFKE